VEYLHTDSLKYTGRDYEVSIYGKLICGFFPTPYGQRFTGNVDAYNCGRWILRFKDGFLKVVGTCIGIEAPKVAVWEEFIKPVFFGIHKVSSPQWREVTEEEASKWLA
jgi:hypothetical protein